MSVEGIQLLHEDYIRLTERFKSLWTFHQFLRGVQKTFFSAEPGYSLDFNALYEEVKGVASQINSTSPEAIAPRIRELFERLDRVAAALREVDRRVSPSHVRRFFERVRPLDDKIAFHLLRFYFSQTEVDEDIIDKVDFLATVVATGGAEVTTAVARPRPEIRKFFESVTATSVWPRLDSTMTPALVKAFDELASDMARAREFEDLLTDRLLNNVRTMKRRVAAGLANADVLTAIACCNLTTRSVFHRLYEREERRLDEATGRITDLERELLRGEEGPPADEFRRFRESRMRFDQQAMERNVRAQQVLELKAAISEVLQKFDISGLEAEDIDEALELVEEVDAEDDGSFWKPLLDRILPAVELYDDGTGALRPELAGLAHLRLEPWELKAARRAVAGGKPAGEKDAALLRAAALRLKAEEETETLRHAAEGGGPSEEALRAARAILARASQLDTLLAAMIDEAHATASSEEIRSWTRSRFRMLRATADLWLMQDVPRSDRPTRD
jgi:hypothetical protein